jgi:hypothetical protein
MGLWNPSLSTDPHKIRSRRRDDAPITSQQPQVSRARGNDVNIEGHHLLLNKTSSSEKPALKTIPDHEPCSGIVK